MIEGMYRFSIFKQTRYSRSFKTYACIFSERNVYTFNKRCCKIESVLNIRGGGMRIIYCSNCSLCCQEMLVKRVNHKSAFCFPNTFRMLRHPYTFYERHPCYQTFYVNVVYCYNLNCQSTY